MSETPVRTSDPFRLDGLVKTPLPAVRNRWLEIVVETAFGLSTLEAEKTVQTHGRGALGCK